LSELPDITAKQDEKADVAFITAEVVRGDLKSIILSTGKVRAVSTINVGTQISGTVKDIYVDYNSIVKKGQLIALIDPATAETDVQQAQAALLSAQADLMEAEATWSNKKQDLSRSRELFSRELIARADLDAGETAVTTAKARVAAARAVIARQSASLKKSQLLLGYTRIYSPVNGVVISRNVDAGQTVAANFNTPTLVEIAEDLSRMQVEVNVDEADIGKIKKGLKVEFT
jgi:Multidrug resistance efflux pump